VRTDDANCKHILSKKVSYSYKRHLRQQVEGANRKDAVRNFERF
jgi:hypothetical protein